MPNNPASTPANFVIASGIRMANEAAIREAAEVLRAGALVAFPTETVYGLGADATNGEAVARIFEAKGRPHFNPLIVHVADLDAAEQLGVFSAKARRLAGAFWPGPLTLVVERKADAQTCDLVSAGLATLALRVPDHPVARALLRAAGQPLAAPSANRSGHISATTARHVADDLGTRVSMILDGGPTAHGLESTILDASSDRIALLRPGAIPVEPIEYLLGEGVEQTRHTGARPLAPGQLASHYAPRATMRLNALTCEQDEALLAFGEQVPASFGPVINLSPRGDMIEAAAGLFSALRQLDQSGATAIAVMPIPNAGLGAAINDRLERAAAPRP